MNDAVTERFSALLGRIDIHQHLSRMAKHDLATQLHLIGVGRLAGELATRLNEDASSVELIMTAGLLHDIGKIFIPAFILTAPRALNDDEWKKIRTHPITGARLLNDAGEPLLARIVEQHHEKLDGTGYPNELRGRDIAFETQIVSIVDFFDATRWRRAYRTERMTTEDVIHMIEERSGSHFNPEIVKVAVSMFRDDPQNHDADSPLNILR